MFAVEGTGSFREDCGREELLRFSWHYGGGEGAVSSLRAWSWHMPPMGIRPFCEGQQVSRPENQAIV